MLFHLLHRPPGLDFIGLTMHAEELPESLAIKLSERLEDARRQTIAARKQAAGKR